MESDELKAQLLVGRDEGWKLAKEYESLILEVRTNSSAANSNLVCFMATLICTELMSRQILDDCLQDI